MEGSKECWMEGAHSLQMAAITSSQDWTHSFENFWWWEYGCWFWKHFWLHTQGRKTGSLLFLTRDDHLVRFSLQMQWWDTFNFKLYIQGLKFNPICLFHTQIMFLRLFTVNCHNVCKTKCKSTRGRKTNSWIEFLFLFYLRIFYDISKL